MEKNFNLQPLKTFASIVFAFCLYFASRHLKMALKFLLGIQDKTIKIIIYMEQDNLQSILFNFLCIYQKNSFRSL